MINFRKNNLANATSVYLQSHKNNPVFWQEWSADIILYAKQQNKPIFISSGYATCHWCHGMMRETFAHQETATFLNEHFVCVTIDREQRPDIDSYLMSYALETQGAAGWPLNAILTPDLKPCIIFSYLPATAQESIPSLLEVLEKGLAFYQEHADSIPAYQMATAISLPDIDPFTIINRMSAQYDQVHGGFGQEPKFPAHSTLIFLIHFFECTNDQTAYSMVKKTLDVMARAGLHDHLQGGFFRYCADEQWTTPHFEKMLYDQALLLWIYSCAHYVLKEATYKIIAEKIVDCLEQTFKQVDLYCAALSADTDGVEGKTYRWTEQELTATLTVTELEQLKHVYTLHENNDANSYNLIKSRLSFLPALEEKLLAARKKRAQPPVDTTIITDWNALTGIGLVMAYRYAGIENGLSLAEKLCAQLIAHHMHDNELSHSSIRHKTQKECFLQDYASLLLLVTYLHEDTGNYKDLMLMLQEKLHTFNTNNTWYEIQNSDFMPIPALTADNAVPAGSSIAQYALTRTAILVDQDVTPSSYKEPLIFDFLNLNALTTTGNLYIIQSPEKIPWLDLPLTSIQRRGPQYQLTIGQECTTYDTLDALLQALTES